MDIYSPVGTFSCLHQRMKASALCPGSRKRDKDEDKEKKRKENRDGKTTD